MSYELFIAKRYLRSKQKTGFISIITYIAAGGVILGVAALIIMLSVTNGFSGEVKNRLIGMNAHVSIRRFYGGAIVDHDSLLQRVARFPGVVAAAPVIESGVVIAPKTGASAVPDGIALWGVEPGRFVTVSDLPKHLVYDSGQTLQLGVQAGEAHPGIILGEQLARRLRVGPGSEVLLMTVQNMDLEEVMMGITPKLWQFVVTNTFESGMFHYDDNYAFVSLQDAQRILGFGDGVSNIHLRVEDLDSAVEVGDELDAALGYPYKVLDWTDLFPELFRWMQLEKWVIFIALSLIIVVAAFNIMSILVMSILVKTPEIGILKAMGSTARGIRRIFVLQALAIGLVGTLLGCALGLVVCLLQQHFQLISIPGDIYIISSLPVDMEALDFLAVSAVSVAICLLASLYPARKAASLMPVEAIRYIM